MGDYSDIERYANIVLNNILLHRDKDKTTGVFKYFLVEGETDREFYNRILNDNVRCIAVAKLLGSNNVAMGKPIVNNESCKRAILRLMYGRSEVPAKIKWPKGSETLALYGMIDKDYDDDEKYEQNQKIKNLFITFVHDLEMMLIATDKAGVFSRIPNCKIIGDDLHKAEFVAYQLAEARNAIRKYSIDTGTGISHGRLSDDSGFVHYEQIFDNLKICIEDAVDKVLKTYQFDEGAKVRHKDGIIKQFAKDRAKSKFSDSNLDAFDIFDVNLFNVVNGHDYLAAVAYVNQDAYEKFSSSKTKGLNRDFEMALINAYDLKKFRMNPTYRELRKAELVKEL